jgi:hypothetical protein
MRLFLLTFCCAAAIFLVGCSDDTNSVGNKLITSNDKYVIADTTFIAVKDTVFNVSSVNGYGPTTVIGKTNDVEAKAWLRFLPALASGTLPDSIASCTIDTVQLHLTVDYTWNAPASPAQYEIREALSGWTQAGATRDSLAMLQIGQSVLGRIADTLSVNREIVVTMDSTAVRRWITYAKDATASPMYGYVIVPKPGTTTGAFGYYSSTSSASYPKLVVHYSGTNGVRDSLTFIYSEDTFIASAQATTAPELEVRGGVSTWSKLIFDVSSLSKAVIINNATVELTQKSSSTLLGVGAPDSVYAYISKAGGTVSTIDSTYRLLGKRKDNTSSVDPVYVFTVTPFIQYLIAPGSPYDGIVVHAAVNNGAVDHMVFHSTKDPDATKRPRLLVTSSKK